VSTDPRLHRVRRRSQSSSLCSVVLNLAAPGIPFPQRATKDRASDGQGVSENDRDETGYISRRSCRIRAEKRLRPFCQRRWLKELLGPSTPPSRRASGGSKLMSALCKHYLITNGLANGTESDQLLSSVSTAQATYTEGRNVCVQATYYFRGRWSPWILRVHSFPLQMLQVCSRVRGPVHQVVELIPTLINWRALWWKPSTPTSSAGMGVQPTYCRIEDPSS